MLKRIRKFVTDSPSTRSHRVGDEVLHAERLPKVIANGTVWAGALRPMVDMVVETLGQLSNGLSSGRVLNAEQLAGVLGSGRTWVGDLVSRIRSAAASTSGGQTVDVGETLAEAERLDKLLRSAAPTSGAVGDALRRLRRAASCVDARACSTTSTSDWGRRVIQVTPQQRPVLDRSGRPSAALNAALANANRVLANPRAHGSERTAASKALSDAYNRSGP